MIYSVVQKIKERNKNDCALELRLRKPAIWRERTYMEQQQQKMWCSVRGNTRHAPRFQIQIEQTTKKNDGPQ